MRKVKQKKDNGTAVKSRKQNLSRKKAAKLKDYLLLTMINRIVN